MNSVEKEQMVMALENLLDRVKRESPEEFCHRKFSDLDQKEFTWLYPNPSTEIGPMAKESHIIHITWREGISGG